MLADIRIDLIFSERNIYPVLIGVKIAVQINQMVLFQKFIGNGHRGQVLFFLLVNDVPQLLQGFIPKDSINFPTPKAIFKNKIIDSLNYALNLFNGITLPRQSKSVFRKSTIPGIG